MGRRLRVLAATAVASGAVAVTAGLAIAAGPRASGLHFLTGAGLLLLGAAFTVARLAGVSIPGQEPTRWWRGGWVGMVLGLALLGPDFGDRWVATRAAYWAALDRGQTAAKAGDWAESATAYTEAIRLDPESADALRRRGTAYVHLGEYDLAIADMDAALRLAPAEAGTTYNRGLARAKLGDTAGAIADFTEAIRLDPTLARAYKARSLMHNRAGNAAQAEADWRRAVELDPALNQGGGLEL